MTIAYTREGSVLLYRRVIDPEHGVLFRAEQVRQERTGTHARVAIIVNGATLSWSSFNVERDEDRTRLSNSAYTHLNGLGTTYPKTHLKHDLDLFCAGLWDEQIAGLAATELGGSYEARPPSFLLKPFVLSGGGTIIFAPPGRGKSYVMLLMAVSLDHGLSRLWPSEASKVLFINLERSALSISDRLGNVNAALGLPRTRKLLTLNARGKSLMDVLPSAERAVRERGVECVFLDSISRAGRGDLNENQTGNHIIDGLNGLCESWVGLAHTPRNDESHLFGSVHFEAGADIVAQLVSQQEEGGPLAVGLRVTKQNDIGLVAPWRQAMEFGEAGLTGIRPCRPGEFPEVESAQLSPQAKVREHLLKIGASSVADIAKATDLTWRVVDGIVRGGPEFRVLRRSDTGPLYAVTAESA